MVILRCDSPDDLYPVVTRPQAFLAGITDLWHERLGHPGLAALSRTLSSFDFTCNKSPTTTCHACRLGKHVRLPFKQSDSQASFPFALVHCDVWTSPITSVSGFQYYLVLLDDSRTMYGLFLYVASRMCSPLSLAFIPLSPPNFNVTS